MLTSSRDEFASNAEVGSSYVCGRDGRRMEQKGAKQPCINIIDTELVYISETKHLRTTASENTPHPCPTWCWRGEKRDDYRTHTRHVILQIYQVPLMPVRTKNIILRSTKSSRASCRRRFWPPLRPPAFVCALPSKKVCSSALDSQTNGNDGSCPGRLMAGALTRANGA